MYHLVDSGFIQPETYGSIPGRTAQEAMSLLQQIFDNHRLTRRNLLADFNNAAGCYDCIRQNLSSICAYRLGCTMLLILCHCLAQLHMCHYIRTAAGISKGFMQWDSQSPTVKSWWNDKADAYCYTGNFGGVGQGGGASPVLWLSVMLPMIDTYREFAGGATVSDPLEYLAVCIWVLSYVDDNTLVRSFSHDITAHNFWELASKEFSSWHRILQITGGNLAIDKCTCTVMKWQWSNTYGLPSLASNKDFPGTVTIVDAGKHISLKRLEPWQAERQLGLRLPTDGSFDIEYRHRISQSKKMATLLKKAPLTSHEAYTHFRQYYIPSMSYPFPVTTFSTKQCQEIQRHYIFTLLPKLGINRHMPRAPIYAPTSLGGAQLLDLRVLQVVHQLQSLQQHIRRQDATGMSLCANYRALQVLVGSSKPFLQLDYSLYKHYIDCNNRWAYVWNICQDHNISIQATFLWAPVSRYAPNDISLMDTAVHHPNYKRDPNKLHAINACRIYLQIFFLSDMATYTGKHINRRFIDGSTTFSKPICTFPSQPYPTPYQWSIWRTFITSNFLCSNYQLQPSFNPATAVPVIHLQDPPPTLVAQFLHVIDNSNSTTNVSALFASLPTFFQFLLQACHFLWDSTARKNIHSNLCSGQLSVATDGSLLHSTGAGSFGVIICPNGNSDFTYSGFAPIPNSTNPSSLTTEHYGLLTLTAILHIVYSTSYTPEEKQLHTKKTFPAVPVYIDNTELVKRGNRVSPIRLTLKEHSVSDYDLWEFTNLLLKPLPIRLSCEWVKSHQDDNAALTDLDLPAQLNVAADQCASAAHHRDYPLPSLQKPFLSSSMIGFFDKDEQEIIHFLSYFTDSFHSQPALQYMADKYLWSKSTLTSIHWQSLANSMTRLPLPQRLKQLQFLHNWQNVGQQKVQFAMAASAKTGVQLSSDTEKDLHKCPLNCGSIEQHGHYLLCTSNAASITRTTSIKTISQHLKKANTCPGLITLIQQALQQPTPTMSPSDHPSYFEKMLPTLLSSQASIGWDAFRRGFISNIWCSVQRRYASSELDLPLFDTDSWATTLVQLLWSHSHALWELRNTGLHGSNIEESRGKRLRLLRQRVKQLYDHEDRKFVPPTQQASYFGLPLSQRRKQGLYSLTSWIQFIERRLHYHREEAMKRTIHAWLKKDKTCCLKETTS